MGDDMLIKFDKALLRHRLTIFLIGAISGFLSYYFFATRQIFFSSWYRWNSVTLAFGNIFGGLSLVALVFTIYISVKTLCFHIKEGTPLKELLFLAVCLVLVTIYGYLFHSVSNPKSSYIRQAIVVDMDEQYYCIPTSK